MMSRYVPAGLWAGENILELLQIAGDCCCADLKMCARLAMVLARSENTVARIVSMAPTEICFRHVNKHDQKAGCDSFLTIAVTMVCMTMR